MHAGTTLGALGQYEIPLGQKVLAAWNAEHPARIQLRAELEGDRARERSPQLFREAALGRRLDRLTRQVERLERHITISNEALALFVRFWLTVTPPLPDTAQPAAQTKGRERYEGFVEALGRRLARGQTLAQEISLDIEPAQASPIVPRK